MRFGLIDLLFAIACTSTGSISAQYFTSGLPHGNKALIGIAGGVGLYLILVYPFYRILRLFPMILPRCPCCRRFQPAFQIVDRRYPRIVFRCPTCDGQFVIWHNGKAGDDETWATPVLTLNWPYAFGIYRQSEKPEQ
ncbi:hypothetical protein K227x_49550 [Rubripirellula lacrimiformis]|uniref:Uncharacterized protein n=1 Tax=Rubripirellula lacrimiformis TaxID=1930273 RepID=A0A517NHD6_9BACT|nr:hypothetical protein K227x_49550 [Rubripirellula lacrimiformis]